MKALVRRCVCLLVAVGTCVDADPLGPFCPERNGQRECKDRKWLCGCASSSCQNGGAVDWQVLRNLDFSGGVVRMGTFKNLMKAPAWLTNTAGVDWSWIVGMMGGAVEREVDGTANIVVPSHTWNEIELPHSNCYLILGGQTSTLRDTTNSAFRLVVHDTTFRHYEREPGKLTYEGLFVHKELQLTRAHIDVLQHLIQHGDVGTIHSNNNNKDKTFERSTDQDADLSPLYIEFPPLEFRYADRAYGGMVAAYTGLFDVYRTLISVLEEPVLNCVVVALLFGKAPHELLSIIPREAHQATRATAEQLNRIWHSDFHPILQRAKGILKASVEAPAWQPEQPPETEPTWWQRLLGSTQAAVTRPTRISLNFQKQVERFRIEFIREVLEPIGRALSRYDPKVGKKWMDGLNLMQLSRSASDGAAGSWDSEERLANSCEAESVVHQLLFCPDWRQTAYWLNIVKASRGGQPADLSRADLVKEVNIAARKILFWDAAKKLHKHRDVLLYPHHTPLE